MVGEDHCLYGVDFFSGIGHEKEVIIDYLYCLKKIISCLSSIITFFAF